MRPMGKVKGKGKGRRKVAMELIKDKQSRMVSFSKRRQGLMKKAEEFYSITGSSIALIVLSQAGRPFVYGAPCFDSVIHRFQHHINTINHNHNETQGSKQEHHNAAVYRTNTRSCTTTTTTTIPPDPTVPENNNLVAHVADQIQEPPWPAAFLPDPTSEFLIGQGSAFTTDSDDQQPDHSFYASLPPPDQVVDHSFEVPPPPPPPPEILFGQGSTTDYSHQVYDDYFYLLDTAPWLAASADHRFHAPPEVVSIRVPNITTP